MPWITCLGRTGAFTRATSHGGLLAWMHKFGSQPAVSDWHPCLGITAPLFAILAHRTVGSTYQHKMGQGCWRVRHVRVAAARRRALDL